MPTSEQSWMKELYAGVIGWISFTVAFACWYFLVRVVFSQMGFWGG